MARIFVAFFNGIIDNNNSSAMPVFYEGFIQGLLNAGNDVCVAWHRSFGVDFSEISEETALSISRFNPDLCILFNNSYYDLSDVVNCPIVIYEVDSPLYYSNKDAIKKRVDRYLFITSQTNSVSLIKETFGALDNQVFYIPLFTEVYADKNVKQMTNISFIGSKFGVNPQLYTGHVISELSISEKEIYYECMKDIRKNPFITKGALVEKYNINSEKLMRYLSIPEIVMMLSTEKRIHVLSSISDLGLELYGLNSWKDDYYFESRLNFCFVDEKVYSIKHNQDIYNSSKLGISVAHLQAVNGFPWRIMDIMASNACLVTDYHSDFENVFQGIEIPIYETEYDARVLCKKLLNNEQLRREIVLQCQELIEQKYRFKHFLSRLEDCIRMKLHQ